MGNPVVHWELMSKDPASRKIVDAPVKYMDMLHHDFKAAPAETRHL
jgi:hypothetical protein